MQPLNFDFGPTKPFSVTELTRHIQRLFSRDDLLRNVLVEGEVSNFKRYPSGHAYFTLKDGQCQMRCVMWKAAVQRQMYIPNDGDRVRARGTVEVYDARGEYQLQATTIHALGLGDFYLEFERLKTKLEAEGLFAAEHKRALPAFPRVIGVVTSPGAAAFQDIQNVLRRRYPLARILLSPTQVQGDSAPPLIVAALESLARHGGADVILVARGGGSIEDLWAFNDEQVARAIYASPIPIVTGVGHETDFTLVDFVADLRAPTPSVGAELITPDMQELRVGLADSRLALADALLARIDSARQALTGQIRALRYLSPQVQIDNRRQRLDELDRRLQSAIWRRVEVARDRLGSQQRALIANNPTNILARGYAIVYHTHDGKRIADATVVAPGTSITVQLQRGQLTATVTERKNDKGESNI